MIIRIIFWSKKEIGNRKSYTLNWAKFCKKLDFLLVRFVWWINKYFLNDFSQYSRPRYVKSPTANGKSKVYIVSNLSETSRKTRMDHCVVYTVMLLLHSTYSKRRHTQREQNFLFYLLFILVRGNSQSQLNTKVFLDGLHTDLACQSIPHAIVNAYTVTTTRFNNLDTPFLHDPALFG